MRIFVVLLFVLSGCVSNNQTAKPGVHVIPLGFVEDTNFIRAIKGDFYELAAANVSIENLKRNYLELQLENNTRDTLYVSVVEKFQLLNEVITNEYNISERKWEAPNSIKCFLNKHYLRISPTSKALAVLTVSKCDSICFQIPFYTDTVTANPSFVSTTFITASPNGYKVIDMDSTMLMTYVPKGFYRTGFQRPPSRSN